MIKPIDDFYIVRKVENKPNHGLILIMREQPKKNSLVEVVEICDNNPLDLTIGSKVFITNKNTKVKYNNESCLIVKESNITTKVI